MNIIKYHTVASTNDTLKEMLSSQYVEHFTVIWALHQFAGRGQQSNKWITEEGKNLTFSILLKFDAFKLERQFDLNKLIGIAVKEALKTYFPKIQIKWPNDIMAVNSKIAGILIENSVKGGFIKHSVVGIGINVNQIYFDPQIGNVTSLKALTSIAYHLENILQNVLINIEKVISGFENSDSDKIHQQYMNELYEKDRWNRFVLPDNQIFEAKIVDVSPVGKLVLQNRDGNLLYFGVQEVRLYQILD